MDSVIQSEKECLICKRTTELHKHHIFGASNRKKSEQNGMWCYLCIDHHTGNSGVHFNRELDLKLKRKAQKKYEETHSRAEFMKIFGRSYL